MAVRPACARPSNRAGTRNRRADAARRLPSGIYQLGFEAILQVTIPATAICWTTSPSRSLLIDLGGSQMNAVAIEAETPAIKGADQWPRHTPSRWCSASGTAAGRGLPPGQPAGLPGSTPTLETQERQRYLDSVGPARQYHGGLSTVGGGVISLPFEALAMTLPKTTRPRSAGARRQRRVSLHWTGTWKIRSAAAPAIPSNRPAISSRKRCHDQFSGTVYNDRTATRAGRAENWTSVELWPRTSTSTSCARTKSCRRRRWSPRRGSYQFAAPSDTDYHRPVGLPAIPLHPPGLLAFQEPGVRHARPLFRRPGRTSA